MSVQNIDTNRETDRQTNSRYTDSYKMMLSLDN